jgi:hypothetical protein
MKKNNFLLTKLVLGGRMLYRPLLLLLLLSLLHSSFIAKHLTMNSLPMCIAMMVYIYSFFSRSFYFECTLFIRLSIGQTVILGVKEKEYRSHFYLSLFLLADVVMLVIICVHRRSSILSFRSKVVVVVRRFFLAFVLFVFCFFFFLRSLSPSSIRSS